MSSKGDWINCETLLYALNVEVIPSETQLHLLGQHIGVLTKPWRKVAPCSPTCLPVKERLGSSIFMSLKVQQDAQQTRIEHFYVSKTSEQMPTKLGHELERAELSVLVVGQDENDVGS